MASGFMNVAKEQENKKTFDGVDLGSLIKQVAGLCEPMIHKNKNRLKFNMPEALPTVWANAGECTQILWNLLDNAARHTYEGVVTIRAENTGKNITITVSDTGEGISPELLRRVLERGISGSDERSGLGLAICKEIVDAHGGMIDIVSEQASGTTVTFTLPIAKEGEHE